jgi:hypothetical protein
MEEESEYSSKYIKNCYISGKKYIPEYFYIENNQIDNSSVSISNTFDGEIKFSGCSQSDPTQENHILGTTGGMVSPKNIVFRTIGGGSFSRDDILTTIKGDIRGVGANDLSLVRTQCSQVASGNYSSILGGIENRTSNVASIVIGGSNNQSLRTNSVIVAGNLNTNISSNSTIITGNGNINSNFSSSSIIVSGSNNLVNSSNSGIMTGIDQFIGDGQSNFAIITGSNNDINITGTARPNSTILTGETNYLRASNSTIVSGNNQNVQTNSSGVCFVTGLGNNILPDTNVGNISILNGISNFSLNAQSCIISGSNNTLPNISRANNMIFTGLNNTNNNSTGTASNSSVITGIDNKLGAGGSTLIFNGSNNQTQQGSSSVSISGNGNTIQQSNSILVSGQGNALTNLSRGNSILFTGLSNINNSSRNTLITGNLNNLGTSGASNHTFIGTGTNNLTAFTESAIVTGNSNRQNTTSSSNSIIFTGSNNDQTFGSRGNNLIGTGIGNTGTNSVSTGIFTGKSNINNTSAFISGAVISTGENNTINSLHSYIGSGVSNSILTATSTSSSIISGLSNTCSNRTNTSIGTGFNNSNIDGNSICITGNRNRITSTSTSLNAFIGTGTSNSVPNLLSLQSGVLTGSQNTVSNANSAIVTGSTNRITSTLSFIGGGQSNLLSATQTGVMTGVNSTMIGTTTNSCVGSGALNEINAITNSFAAGFGLCNTTQNSSASFGQFNAPGVLNTSNRIFMIGNGTGAAALRRNAFSVTFDGNCYGAGFINGGADFSEYFESYNGQNIEAGTTVCMVNDGKIIPSSLSSSDPFGVVVKKSGFVGNASEDEWIGKYEKDEKGEIIYDTVNEEIIEDEFQTETVDVEVLEKDNLRFVKNIIQKSISIPIMEEQNIYDLSTNEIMRTEQIQKKKITIQSKSIPRISPLFDTSLTYIPRSQRSEWHMVALVGQVVVSEGQKINPEWDYLGKSKYILK